MPGQFWNPFEVGSGQVNDINLSTSSSSSSSKLLSDVRAERSLREKQRLQDRAARLIQKEWRSNRALVQARGKILQELKDGTIRSYEDRGRALFILLRSGSKGKDVDRDESHQLIAWLEEGIQRSDGQLPLLRPLLSETWVVVLSVLYIRAAELIAMDPTSPEVERLFRCLMSICDPKAYSSMDPSIADLRKAEFAEDLGRRGWTETLVSGLRQLIAISKPKSKHPNIDPIIQLILAPVSLSSPSPATSLLPPLIHTLLAVPALPSSLPLSTLTYLSTHLPLFTILLPFAASHPEILQQGDLKSEAGKTYFLANLATFGITGGMLARNTTGPGILAWMSVISTVLRSVGTGWIYWVEGTGEPPKAAIAVAADGDVDMNGGTSSASAVAHKERPALPKNIASKVSLLASSSHVTTLASIVTSPSSKLPTSTLLEFTTFAISLLNAFRGSPKWEIILQTLLEGTSGKAFIRRMWREGVRGRWANTSDSRTWETFNDNTSRHCLILLTYIYNHYMLITPDDEFFATNPSTNPLTMDELLDLTGIWRDLGFWSYMKGVAPAGSELTRGLGTEEVRNILTTGVTRVSDRNARRPFAKEDFFVMSAQMDLNGFVAAAVVDDAQLSVTEGADTTDLTHWANARSRITKRQMAYLSPRLGLLNNLPMTIPFSTRLEVFEQFIRTDQKRYYQDHRRERRVNATIHRKTLAEDGFDQLNDYGPALKRNIYIQFIDQFGQEEAGIDGGGLFKEFLTNLSKEVFNTDRGLWLATDQNQLYPNPHSYATEAHQLEWYRFIGRILGKAIYEGILVDVSFAGFFLAKWLGKQSHLDDLQSLDKELYKGLIILKNYPKPEDLSLNFTITAEEFGATQSIDLIPNGSEVAVTAENRNEYIQLVCKYKLDKQIAQQSRAFFSGLSDLIDVKWLRMFDQQELRQLIGGEETVIDIEDLRAHTTTSGFPNDTTMQYFWKVVKGFNQEERRALLRFVTSCARPPLLGFAHLNPNFGIRCSGADRTRLPSASSCMNLLKLPAYDDEINLRRKLLQAITSGAGFDLS